MVDTITEPPRPETPDLRARGLKRLGDPLFRWLAISAGVSVLVVLALMIATTTRDAMPVFLYQGFFDFLFGTEWQAGFSRSEFTGQYGAWPFIYGTLITSAIAVAIALPLAIAVSLYINRIAPKRLRTTLSYTVEMLAAIPSVVYGLWGLLFFGPVILRPAMEVLETGLAWIPIVGRVFAGPIFTTSYFTAGVVLAIMILPIITAVTREVMAQVPSDQIDAAYGMGATDWEVMRRVIIRSSFPGVVGATMLGLGRALGETMAVAMLVGGSQRWASSLFFGGDALAAHIANTFQDASPETIVALIGIGVVLFIITVIVNVAARLLVWRIGRVAGDAAL